MRLWVVRHGKAEQISPTGRDFDRELMDRGKRQALWLGQTIACKKQRPALIATSGLARAVQTAKLINEALGCELEVVRELQTGYSVSEALAAIERRAIPGGLMVVGHNPTFGELVWVLERGIPAQEAEMKTGEAAVFDFEDGIGAGKGRLRRRLRLDED